MNTPTCFAFYGTLMGDHGRGRDIAEMGRSHGRCVIPGDLYSVSGAFPAIMPGDGHVIGELWEPSPRWLAACTQHFDGIEGYHPENEATSLYLRQAVELVEPEGTRAWTYIWNGDPSRLQRIESGDWKQFDAPLSFQYHFDEGWL